MPQWWGQQTCIASRIQGRSRPRRQMVERRCRRRRQVISRGRRIPRSRSAPPVRHTWLPSFAHRSKPLCAGNSSPASVHGLHPSGPREGRHRHPPENSSQRIRRKPRGRGHQARLDACPRLAAGVRRERRDHRHSQARIRSVRRIVPFLAGSLTGERLLACNVGAGVSPVRKRALQKSTPGGLHGRDARAYIESSFDILCRSRRGCVMASRPIKAKPETTAEIVTYRGATYPWQCDHIGHMNIIWYVSKFDEANWNLFAPSWHHAVVSTRSEIWNGRFAAEHHLQTRAVWRCHRDSQPYSSKCANVSFGSSMKCVMPSGAKWPPSARPRQFIWIGRRAGRAHFHQPCG